jgi:hypothetical protein
MSSERQRWAWQHLRLLRTSRPGLAAKGKRGKIFSAALEQSEQLMHAAQNVGPAARPLPLFYALSQATRAICVARLDEHYLLTAHGLKWPGIGGDESLLERLVEPAPTDSSSFQRLCAALGCDELSAPVALGAAWRALPDLGLPSVEGPDEWMYAAPVLPREPIVPQGGGRPSGMDWIELGVALLPWHDNQRESLVALLGRYPQLADAVPAGVPGVEGSVGLTRWNEQAIPMVKVRAESAHRPAWNKALEQVAPMYCGGPERFAIPRLPSGDFLHPLALWWIVLFGLSNAARYEPDHWLAALDIDKSPLGVPLESCLNEALDSVPHLVLEALVGEPLQVGSYP